MPDTYRVGDRVRALAAINYDIVIIPPATRGRVTAVQPDLMDGDTGLEIMWDTLFPALARDGNTVLLVPPELDLIAPEDATANDKCTPPVARTHRGSP